MSSLLSLQLLFFLFSSLSSLSLLSWTSLDSLLLSLLSSLSDLKSLHSLSLPSSVSFLIRHSYTGSSRRKDPKRERQQKEPWLGGKLGAQAAQLQKETAVGLSFPPLLSGCPIPIHSPLQTGAVRSDSTSRGGVILRSRAWRRWKEVQAQASRAASSCLIGRYFSAHHFSVLPSSSSFSFAHSFLAWL